MTVATPRRLVWALTLLCLAGYVFVYATGRASEPIRSDGFSYYVYLPSWWLFHDSTLAAVARDCCGGTFPDFTAIIRWPGTRRWVNAHPIGVALMQAPFFLVADALTWWTNLSRDGFTLYYQHAVGIAGLAWTMTGLWVLAGVLARHFSVRVTNATLIALLFGTNLYHYATYDSFYSHSYSFFLVAALIDLTERWHESPTRDRSLLVGLVAGLIVLVRHTNILILAVIPLYVIAAHGPRGALHLAIARARALLLFAVAGLFLLRGPLRAFLIPTLVVLLADTYLIASWWDWQFGASYGHRGFIDLFPLLSLGLAAFFTWSAAARVRLVTVATTVIVLSALSTIQMLQYWNGVLPGSDLTWSAYRALFLKL